MFIDKISIYIKAGDGGNGCTSFHTEKFVANGGPDGGDGGRGGDVIFVARSGATSLNEFRYTKHFRAENGQNGTPKRCNGKTGKDLIITVPRGTVIRDYETGSIIADLCKDGQSITVLTGGDGGRGNARFKTSRRQAPHFSQDGKKTQEHEVTLELKLIADVGLVGYPNAGKSTLLSSVTRATPKIGNYKFTTLFPNLGIETEHGFVIADIPGLIDGASEGAGLGTEFLRHIERTRLIVHVVDAAALDGGTPYENYLAVRNELKNYGGLDALPELVALNKSDLLNSKDVIKDFEKRLGRKVYLISAATQSGVKELMNAVNELLASLPVPEPEEFEPFVYEVPNVNEFTVTRADDGAFVILGPFTDEIARTITLDDRESFTFFQKRLKEGGVIKQLLKSGMKQGDTVRICGAEFTYEE